MIDYHFGGFGMVRIWELESNLKSREDRICQDDTARLVVVEWGLKLKYFNLFETSNNFSCQTGTERVLKYCQSLTTGGWD